MKLISALLKLSLGCLLTFQVAFAQEFSEGEDYQILSIPLPLQKSDKIEVAEYFRYTCGACFMFETTAKNWKSQLPSDVAFIYSPVALNSVEETMSKAFYTAQVLGVLDQVHQPFFDTFHIERKMISSVDQVEEFFTKAGVDKERFRKTFNSFGVTSAAKQAKTRDETAKINSTPSLVINGKYLIQVQSNSGGGNAQERLLKVADYIIEEIRNKRM